MFYVRHKVQNSPIDFDREAKKSNCIGVGHGWLNTPVQTFIIMMVDKENSITISRSLSNKTYREMNQCIIRLMSY